MSHLSKSLSDKALQSQVRRHLDQRPGFQIPEELPDVLREKLVRLDQAVAERPKS